MTLLARSFTADKLYFGVYSAIVATVGDQKHPGEVQLRFDWFDPQMKTEWCRICNPYAGNGYGTVWHPEKDDEVLVAFLQGDMRWPIVLGGLYNGQDAPPTARTDSLDQKLWRTKGGHELLMDDTSGQKRVRIQTDAGHTLDLDDQGKKVTLETEGGHSATFDDQGKKVTVETTGGHSVTLDDNGPKIAVKSSGGHSVTLDDSGPKLTIQTTSGNSVTLDDGGAKITVQTAGGQIIALESGSIKITATSVIVNATSVKLGGDAASMSLVLGEALMAAYNAHTHNCTAPGAPSGPPLSPMTSAVLSQVSKTA
jgi:phage baseplate assembly protein gpV